MSGCQRPCPDPIIAMTWKWDAGRLERDKMRLIYKNRAMVVALLGASALISPQAQARAKVHHASPLEARMAKLEAEVTQLRAELATARGEQSQALAAAQAANTAADAAASSALAAITAATTAANTAGQTATALAALEKKPIPEGMRSGATTIKLGGYLKLMASNSHFSDGSLATQSLGRDFYLPQQIPTAGKSSRVQDFTAKQTRLWMNLETQVAGHVVKGYVETDFQTSPGTQGSQRTTNGYNLALRRAYMQVDRFTFGQDWTTFQYTGALPESTDYVGATEGTVFVRQPQIRYSAPLSKQVTLHVAMENPESGTATAGSATLVENGVDHMPDFTARLAYAGPHGELSLAGVARQVRVENAGVGSTAGGFGASAAGKLWLNADKTSDLRFMVTYGHDIGRYVGLNFAPDAVYVPGTGKLEGVNVFATFAALRLGIAPKLRVNLIGSYQNVHYADALTLAQVGTFNKRAWSAAANLFYSPVKNTDIGIEYRHGEHDLVSGASGTLDRIEFAAKYSF